MKLYKDFNDIESDSDRKNAIDTYDYILKDIGNLTSLEKSELRTSIVNGYTILKCNNYD